MEDGTVLMSDWIRRSGQELWLRGGWWLIGERSLAGEVLDYMNDREVEWENGSQWLEYRDY